MGRGKSGGCDKRLIVDSNILQSSGSGGLQAKTCRDFLSIFLMETEHCAVVTPEIWAEWRRHWSRMARSWVASMEARKRIVRVRTADDGTREALERAARSEGERVAILKDVHLVEAAIATDRRIASMDEVMRGLLKVFAASIPQISQVMWVNPNILDEDCTEWLRSGAPLETNRTLGA
jgi:hypothetical protein